MRRHIKKLGIITLFVAILLLGASFRANAQSTTIRQLVIKTFLGLTDTPSSYSGQSGKVVAVNGGETALEFIDAGGGGHTIQEEGSDLAQRTYLNFVGNTVTATDDSGNDTTIVTVDDDLSNYDNTTSLFTSQGDNISTFTNDAGYITATLTQEEVEDYAGAMTTGNTETLISVDYQDADGTIDYVVNDDLSLYNNTTSGFLSSVDLTSDVTGILPLANGGTNKNMTASAGAIAYSDADSLELSSVGTTGQALISGGTGAPTWFSPTAGSIIFAGVSGILSQDNTNFFWDDSNNRLGLGTASPVSQLTQYASTPEHRLISSGDDTFTRLTKDDTLAEAKRYNKVLQPTPTQPENIYSSSFDGVNEGAQVADTASLRKTNNFSLFTWIKTTQSSTNLGIIAKWSSAGNQRSYAIASGHSAGTGDQWEVLLSDNGTFNSGHRKRWISSSSINDGNWHLIGFTFNSGTLTMYTDGVADSSPTKTENDAITAVANVTAPFTTAFFSGGSYIQAKLDEISVWDVELSGSEVTELYNSGIPATLNTHTQIANLSNWYRMGDDPSDDLTGGTGTIIDQVSAANLTPFNTESGDKSADTAGSDFAGNTDVEIEVWTSEDGEENNEQGINTFGWKNGRTVLDFGTTLRGIFNGTTEIFRFDSSGRLGIGVTSPTAMLHLKAGTATANTAPLKFTSGTLNTSPEAGAVEFLTDKWYGTITTGTARKEFTLNDASLTSGTFPVATTNGRLTDSSFTSTTLTSGTYTPTLTNVTNVAASTAYQAQYMRVGATVTVSGKIDIDLTGTGAYELGVSLPVASNFGATEDCAGTAIGTTTAPGASDVMWVSADATNDRASFQGNDNDTSNHTHYFQFTYQVI